MNQQYFLSGFHAIIPCVAPIKKKNITYSRTISCHKEGCKPYQNTPQHTELEYRGANYKSTATSLHYRAKYLRQATYFLSLSTLQVKNILQCEDLCWSLRVYISWEYTCIQTLEGWVFK